VWRPQPNSNCFPLSLNGWTVVGGLNFAKLITPIVIEVLNLWRVAGLVGWLYKHIAWADTLTIRHLSLWHSYSCKLSCLAVSLAVAVNYDYWL